jgi:hypothetical protein
MEKLIRWTVLVGLIACMVLALWAAAGLAQTTVPLESLRAVGNGRLLGIVDNRVVPVRLRGLSIVGDELQLLDPPRAPSMWAVSRSRLSLPSVPRVPWMTPRIQSD